MSDYSVGDRVEIIREGETGRIYAIWPGSEDTIEIRLDSGGYVGRDPRHLRLLAAALRIAEEPPDA